jgi:membrane protease subunit HflK
MRYIVGIGAVALVGYLLTGVSQVRPGERAVVRRFGRVAATPGPGLWVGLPWGMDRVDHVAVDRVRRVVVGYQPEEEENGEGVPPGQFLTGDHNLVNVQSAIHYAVDDDQVVAFLEQEGRADALVARAAETALAEWVAGRGIDDILIHGKTRLPGVLVNEVQDRIDGYRLGIQIQQADVAYLFPPEEVRNAFDEVTRAQTSIRTREHESRQEAARLLREAETEKFRLEKQAEAYRAERLRLARAEAERFEVRVLQYHQIERDNPAFLTGIWWDEVGKLFSRLRETGRIDLLDNHLGRDGLDITIAPPLPRKK